MAGGDWVGMIPFGFKLIGQQDKIKQAYAIAEPVIEAAKEAWPRFAPLALSILEELAPQLVRSVKAGTEGDTLASFDVVWLQESLNQLGEKLTVDGDYGEATEEAVERFRKNHGLVDDKHMLLEVVTRIIVELAKRKDKS